MIRRPKRAALDPNYPWRRAWLLGFDTDHGYREVRACAPDADGERVRSEARARLERQGYAVGALVRCWRIFPRVGVKGESALPPEPDAPPCARTLALVRPGVPTGAPCVWCYPDAATPPAVLTCALCGAERAIKS